MAKPARQRHEDEQRHKAGRPAHRQHDKTQGQRNSGEHDPAPGAVDETADADAKERPDERGDEIDLRERDAADPKVVEQRLGDEAQALGASRQRPHHRQRRHDEHDPAVIEPLAHTQRRPRLNACLSHGSIRSHTRTSLKVS